MNTLVNKIIVNVYGMCVNVMLTFYLYGLVPLSCLSLICVIVYYYLKWQHVTSRNNYVKRKKSFQKDCVKDSILYYQSLTRATFP